MIQCNTYSTMRSFFALIAASACFLVSGCGDESQSPQGTATGTSNAGAIKALPLHGKVRLATAPTNAVFGMIWINTTKNREYIYDGAQWVPHDQSVDAFYKSITSPVKLSMTPDEVCVDGDPACTPTGAHGASGTSPAGHYAFECKVCHAVGGRLAFLKNGPAYATGQPTPTFDATAKTCSNIACHAVKAGTFSYYFPDGSGDPQLNTVNYGGGAPQPTPSWYATGAIGCTACHGDPPRNGSDGSNVWHSGFHAGSATSASNQCQFCHPDASSPGNGIGTTITNVALHANGTVNVQATFKSSCFGCH